MTSLYTCFQLLIIIISVYTGVCGGYERRASNPQPHRRQPQTLPINSNYRIPTAYIEAFSPKGLKVSIPHEEGIELFGFHGSVNRPLNGFAGGVINGDVSRSENGRWTFYDGNVKLKSGDVLNYWLFVQKNDLGYRKDNLRFSVAEVKGNPDFSTITNTTLTSLNHPTQAQQQSSLIPQQQPQNSPFFPNLPLQPLQPLQPCQTSIGSFRPQQPQTSPACDQIQCFLIEFQLNNTLQSISELNAKMEPLISEVKILREIINDITKSISLNTKLILTYTGNRSPGSPLEFVRALVVEKLRLIDLYNKILSAKPNPNGNGIIFEVSSLYEKRLILLRGRELLKDSKYKIEDFTEENIEQLIGLKTSFEDQQEIKQTTNGQKDVQEILGDDEIARNIDVRSSADEVVPVGLN